MTAGGHGAPRIGVALGSGSARGLAHIGVMRALHEAGIVPDLVAGTSMGALVGAICAADRLDALETRFLAIDWKGIAALLDPVFPRSGLIDGRRIAAFLGELVPQARVETLPRPFQAVATDIRHGREVALDAGELAEVVRASIAVPGIFTPVRWHDGRVLVDGGLVNPVPVNVARAMGADLVIAVDLNHDIVEHRLAPPRQPPTPASAAMTRLLQALHASDHPALAQLGTWLREEPLPGLFEVLLASVYITQAQITQARLAQHPPDLLIQPPLGAVRFMEFDRAGEIIGIGYDSARRALAGWRPGRR